jgi:hypothetical protein
MLSWKNHTIKTYLIFVLLSLVLLYSERYEAFLISKLFIVPSLLVLIFQWYRKSNHRLIPILLVSTFFSFLGDVFIAIKINEDFFKLISLSTFLVAQSGYAAMFYISSKYNKKKDTVHWNQRWPEALGILIILSFIFIVTPQMGDFQLLGILYGIIAGVSFTLALDRRFTVSFKSHTLVIVGLIFFYISDILAGLDIYMTDILIHTAIIISYALGHYLIVSGILHQIEEETEKKEASGKDAFIE